MDNLDAYYSKVSSFIGCDSKPLISDFEANYRKRNETFFKDFASNIAECQFSYEGTNYGEGGLKLDLIGPMKKGKFSFVLTDRDKNFAYKVIPITMADEVRPFLGGLLKEIIIQTRLMMDNTYRARFIPKLIDVYRTVDFYKESMYYILKMEYLDMTYKDYIQGYINSSYDDTNEKKTVISNLLLGNMIDILNILKYFFTTYSFKHFDIHPDNIMYSGKTMTYKLIDFGYDSYIKIGPYAIGRLDYVSGNKYDVFSLVETYRRDMDKSVYTANFQAKLDRLATIGPSLDYDECLKILNGRNGGRKNRSRKAKSTRKKRVLLQY